MADPSEQWSRAVLRAGQWPESPSNIAALNQWQRSEGGPADNPLNIGPFRVYGSATAGAQATAALIRTPAYKPIAAGLADGTSKPAVVNAIIDSPWEQTHYKGSAIMKREGGGGPSLASHLLNPITALEDIGKATEQVGKTAASLPAFLESVGRAAAWIANPHNWLRVAETLVGVALILLGMWHLSPATAGAVKGAATKAAGLVIAA